MTRHLTVAATLLGWCAAAAAQPKFETPPAFPPDEATLKEIDGKTAELRKAVAALPRGTTPDVRADVEVYLKAAEWIVRHEEWFQKDSGKHTLAVLDAGLARARAAAEGKAPWREVRGKPVVRGYRSSVDGSVQPFSVTLPERYKSTDEKKWRMDVVLHGRDQSLTEVKFIHAREVARPVKGLDYVIVEPYGRGNNAYRWAGETDVREAAKAFLHFESREPGKGPIDLERTVLRGFSMGGAGTWHIGLHHPFTFAVIGPGAGFTTTHGYIRNLPKLPDYQEKCLRIYDAVDYAENAFGVPVVAYSGANDPQKAAADNIEAALKGFKEPVRFTHLVAPGLEHRMPPEWQAKADAEYRKYLTGRKPPERVRFVTYTARYNDCGFGFIEALERQYEKAVFDARRTKDALEIATTNVRAVTLEVEDVPLPLPQLVVIDGQKVATGIGDRKKRAPLLTLVKADGKWQPAEFAERPAQPRKRHDLLHALQGPIDDAFMDFFEVVPPQGEGWHPLATAHAAASLKRFGREWDKYFRADLPVRKPAEIAPRSPAGNLVLFGDPASNPLLAAVVDRLPIRWTKETLEVNGVKYDPRTHVPVLIYPNPLSPGYYVVINSGHTFHEADLKGTNALLYPRLGDWAVLKVAPTEKDPAAAEVVAAGLFDESWQFPKK